MLQQLLKDVRIDRVLNAVAAGTTDQTSSSVDMQDHEGVMFVAAFGALTATQVTQIKGQQSDDDSTFEDITGSLVGPLADGDGNKLLVLDISKPRKRFVRLVVDRGTANAVIDGVTAFLYGPRKYPATQSADVASSEAHVAPAGGGTA